MSTVAASEPAELHLAAIRAHADIEGARILDVGCGTGAFVRKLAGAGADAYGLEVDDRLVSAAIAAGSPSDRIHKGVGEALPFEDGTFDSVCFVFSFHHIPAKSQKAALSEAARVLKPSGWAVVIDPLPFGAVAETTRPIEDEFEVRTNSHWLLGSLADHALRPAGIAHYEIARRYKTADDVIAMAIQTDPTRTEAAANPSVRKAVAARFEALSQALPDGSRQLTQPCAVLWFSKA